MPDQSPVFLNAATVTNGSGNVAAGAANANLAGVANRTTHLSGVTVQGLGATAAGVANLTISGIVTGPFVIGIAIPAGVTTPITPVTLTFNPPLPATGLNTAIVVSVASFGAGNTNASIAAWGIQV